MLEFHHLPAVWRQRASWNPRFLFWKMESMTGRAPQGCCTEDDVRGQQRLAPGSTPVCERSRPQWQLPWCARHKLCQYTGMDLCGRARSLYNFELYKLSIILILIYRDWEENRSKTLEFRRRFRQLSEMLTKKHVWIKMQPPHLEHAAPPSTRGAGASQVRGPGSWLH